MADVEELAKEFYESCKISVRQEVRDRVRNSKQSGKLDLLGMAIDALPETFGRHLPTLTELAVNTNSLERLPASLGMLRCLRSLVVRYNLLASLPALDGLGALQSLDVSNNQLASLPPSIGELPILHHIDCNTNQLERLPDELCQLRALRSLVCHTNRLSALPEDIGALPALQSLDASKNELVCVPESLGYAHQLVELNLATNQLRELPSSLGHLSCVQRLYLRANPPLRALPSISLLASLRVLDVEACGLSELPSITDLPALRELLCKKNPLQRPPASVCIRGLEAIRRYFSELESAGATRSRAARLVLLGDGMAGKTSLQRGLRSSARRSPPPSTRGRSNSISPISSSSKAISSGRSPSRWDLGGQVVRGGAAAVHCARLALRSSFPPPRVRRALCRVIGRWLTYLQAGAPGACAARAHAVR